MKKLTKTKPPTHGGKRDNAGRKPKYNEKTITVSFRIPESKADEIKDLVKNVLQKG